MLKREAKPRIWHSYTWLYISRNPSFKKTRAPQQAVHLLSGKPREGNSKIFTDRLKRKQDALHLHGGLLSSHRKLALKLGNDATSAPGKDLEGSALGNSARHRKITAHDVLSRQKRNRETKGQIYSPQRELENSNSNKGSAREEKNLRASDQLQGGN